MRTTASILCACLVGGAVGLVFGVLALLPAGAAAGAAGFVTGHFWDRHTGAEDRILLCAAAVVSGLIAGGVALILTCLGILAIFS